ncbi:DNA polymerase [Escherichia coli]
MVGAAVSIPGKEAQHYMDLYFERYPGVLGYRKHRCSGTEQGYVETLEGVDHIYRISIQQWYSSWAAEREAINAPMQGTAADIIKRAMIAVDAWLQAENHEHVCSCKYTMNWYLRL